MLLGFTCKYNKHEGLDLWQLSLLYTKYIARFTRQKIGFIETRFEYDKSGVLHVHALIDKPYSMKWAHFHAIAKFDGMHYFKKEIGKVSGWLEYIQKDSVPQPCSDEDQYEHIGKWFYATHAQFIDYKETKTRFTYDLSLRDKYDPYQEWILRSPQQLTLDHIAHRLHPLLGPA